MFDNFLEKHRWLLLACFLVVIIGGGLIIWRDDLKTNKISEDKSVKELRTENETLRKELSEISQGKVAGASVEEDNSEKININTASAEELDKLPNIGSARAQAIIGYREANGGFKSIEEIKNIQGIGDKSFEDLKDLITI